MSQWLGCRTSRDSRILTVLCSPFVGEGSPFFDGSILAENL
jgi:hypothetical protein